MADYGHDLDFGTFLTPQAAKPQAASPARSSASARASTS